MAALQDRLTWQAVLHVDMATAYFQSLRPLYKLHGMVNSSCQLMPAVVSTEPVLPGQILTLDKNCSARFDSARRQFVASVYKSQTRVASLVVVTGVHLLEHDGLSGSARSTTRT